jgi:hypothetical protein
VAARISGRPEIRQLVHEARLIPPAYVKPFVKRQKNDAAGAEAMRGFEPVAQRSIDPGDRWKATHQRPTMRVTPKACCRHDAGEERGRPRDRGGGVPGARAADPAAHVNPGSKLAS